MGENDKVRVGVGLSGGADSAAACLMLQEDGYDILGFTMVVDEAGWKTAEKAGNVAERLHVPHVVVDVRKAFEDVIMRRFVEEYSRGLTPSPCVVCNRFLKFGLLWEALQKHGCQKLATGHYAEIREGAQGRCELWRGKDPRKDQSYFLAQLTPEQLGRTMFPLAASLKADVKDRVKALEIVPRSETESQDLCFVPDGDYAAVLLQRKPELRREGNILELGSGRVLGKHQGAFMFTPGQRRGLGLGGGPWFVVRTDPRNNTVTVSHDGEFQGGKGCLNTMNWLTGEPLVGKPLKLDFQIRYLMRPCHGSISNLGHGRASLQLEGEKVPLLPPGQLAVGYAGRQVICSGWIEREDD